MSGSRVQIEREGGVARVWLARPEARNAMNPELLAELAEAFRALAKDPQARVAVLGGRGESFCAGADIAWMRRAGELPPHERVRDAKQLIEACRAIDEAPFATIARVQGHCYGGGLGLVGACDIVVARDDARFCFSEVRLGVIPAVVSTFVLPKLGFGQARRLFVSAEVLTGAQARDIGLVHAATLEPELDVEVERYVRDVLRNGPKAVALVKSFLRETAPLPRDERLEYSARTLGELRSTPEAQEGLRAFLEKRRPAWVPRKP